MSIVRQARARSGRCGGHGRIMPGVTPESLLASGRFYESGFGDTTVPLSPVDQLALQVNRFGPGAPAAYVFHDTAFTLPVASLDTDLASTAMLIYQRRAMDSFAKFQDAASSALIARANLGMADPVGWVGANLAEVTMVVKGYGDSVGLPAAAGTSIVGQVLSMNPLGVPLWAWIAGGAGAVYFATRKKGRR